jgi:hypothetical protein
VISFYHISFDLSIPFFEKSLKKLNFLQKGSFLSVFSPPFYAYVCVYKEEKIFCTNLKKGVDKIKVLVYTVGALGRNQKTIESHKKGKKNNEKICLCNRLCFQRTK